MLMFHALSYQQELEKRERTKLGRIDSWFHTWEFDNQCCYILKETINIFLQYFDKNIAFKTDNKWNEMKLLSIWVPFQFNQFNAK